MKPRLIVFTDHFPYRGGEQFFETEAERLTSAFEVTILSSNPNNQQTRTLNPDITVYRYDPRQSALSGGEKLRNLIDFVLNPACLQEVFSILGSGQQRLKRIKNSFYWFGISKRLYTYTTRTLEVSPDQNVILYFYWFSYKPIYFALKLANSKVKLVSRVHGYDLYNERQPFGRQPFRKIVDARLDKVLFVSKTGRDYYLKTFAITPSSKHEVMYLGSRHPQYRPTPSSRNDVVIVSCSNMIELKRIDRIIEVLSTLDLPQRHLTWIHFGTGPLLNAITKQAQILLASKPNVTVELRGEVSNTDILRFYQNHAVDCFITLSSSEGLPVSIMEAMSFGIPVVATDVGGIKEMLPMNYPYVVDKDFDTLQVVQLIQRLVGLSAQERQDLSLNLIQKWTTDFNEETNAMKLIACLREL